MKRSLFVGMMFAGMTGTLLTGCMDSPDVYDPNAAKERYDSAWEKTFGEIDPSQNWNTATKCTAKLSIKEDALSEYTFRIYTGNPLSDKGGYVLAETKVTTDAQGKADAQITFNTPASLQDYYISRIDNHGRRVVKAANSQGNTLSATFGNGGTQTRGNVTAAELPTMDCPYTETEVNALIANGYDLSNGLTAYNPYGGVYEISTFNYVGFIVNNTANTPVAVVKSEYTGAPLNMEINPYYAKYVTKGAIKENMYGNIGQTGYDEVWNDITSAHEAKLVIANEGVITLGSAGGEWKIATMDIIVANGGTLKINGKIQMQSGARIIIMPGGTLEDLNGSGSSTPSINHDAKDALIYNAGTVNLKFINMNDAPFYNAAGGVLNVEDFCFANSNETAVLTNLGEINATRVFGKSKDNKEVQGTINNGCLLRSSEQIQVNYLNQAANTAVECEYITFNQLTLRSNSILRTNHLYANNTDIAYVGGSGAALISVDNVDFVNVDWFNITGNIYFEANSFSDENGLAGTDLDDKRTYGGYWKAITDGIAAGNANGISKVGEAPLLIPGSDTGDTSNPCTGKGNKPKDEGGEDTSEPMQWIIACEDLGSTDDFDFNDVVFGVSYDNTANTITVTPLAAGGTLAANIKYASRDLGEIHALLGSSDTNKMINTTSRGTAGTPITIESVSNFDISTNMGGFSIEVTNENGTTTAVKAPGLGDAPQMICVDGSTNWAWPKERVNIFDAYADFGEWGKSYQTNTDWYKNVTGSVVQ